MYKAFILLTFLIISNVFSQVLPEHGIRFRSLLKEVVAHSDPLEASTLNAFEKVKIYELFYKHPSLFTKYLDGKDIDALYNNKEIEKILQKVVGDKSLLHFLDKASSERAKTINKLVHANKDIFEIIEDEASFKKLLKHAGLSEVAEEVMGNKKAMGKMRLNLLKYAWHSGTSYNDLSDNKELTKVTNKLFDKMNADMKKLDFSKSKTIGFLKDANFNIKNPDMKKLAETLVYNYFNQDMPLSTKRNILTGVLDLPPAEHADRLKATVLINTDIEFQKSIQFFSGKSESPVLKTIGRELKSELKYLKDDEVIYILKKLLPKELFAQLSDFKQVAAATTGVGVLAKYKNQPIFIKILRPGIEFNLEKDFNRILKLVKGDNASTGLVMSITEGIREELQLSYEAMNYEIGEYLYSKRGIAIPKVIRDFPVNDSFLALSVAEGGPVSKINLKKISNSELIILGDEYLKAYDVWFSSSMDFVNSFNSVEKEKDIRAIAKIIKRYDLFDNVDHAFIEAYTRMFHGDLHGGNIFFSPNGETFKLTWLDWGNAHKLTLAQERGQIKLLLAATSRSPSGMLEAMQDIVGFNESVKKKLSSKFIKTMKQAILADLPPMEILNRMMNITLEAGVELPASILNWARGKDFLVDKMKEINLELKVRNVLKKGKLVQINHDKVPLTSIGRYLKKSFAKQLFSSSARKLAPLPISVLGRFIVDKANFLFRRYCSASLRSPTKTTKKWH